jgi:hypothetical protein
VHGHLRHRTAPLAAALALAAAAPGALAGPARDAPETPDEPPTNLEPTSPQPRPPSPPDDGVSDPPRAPVDAPEPPAPAAPAPGDPPPAGPGDRGGRTAQPDPAARGEPGNGWIDASHGYLESRLFAPVFRLDRFFSDEQELEAERARSFLRWRNEVRFEDGEARFATSVRASLRFPGVGRALRRLRLVIEGESEEAAAAAEGLGPDRAPDAATRVRTGDAELRLRLWDGLLAHADVGAGVLFDVPPGAFARTRLRWTIPVDGLFLTRVAVIGFYRTDERFGASTELNVERPVARRVLARASSDVRVSQESPGVEWGSELAAFVTLGSRAVGVVGVGANGATRREPVPLEAYRVFTRLRRDFYRSWLFLELSPEYFWPYTPGRGREAAWAVTTRLEVQFQGRPRPPDPEEPEPEPADPPPPAGAAGR